MVVRLERNLASHCCNNCTVLVTVYVRNTAATEAGRGNNSLAGSIRLRLFNLETSEVSRPTHPDSRPPASRQIAVASGAAAVANSAKPKLRSTGPSKGPCCKMACHPARARIPNPSDTRTVALACATPPVLVSLGTTTPEGACVPIDQFQQILPTPATQLQLTIRPPRPRIRLRRPY
jgi:hypothetical protein